MHELYIDVPNDFKYNWSLGKDVDAVLTNMFNVPIEFVVNSLAKITKGDCYRVTLDSEDDVLFFLLKTGFKLADQTKSAVHFEKINKRRVIL